jgi:hypothetical protein
VRLVRMRAAESRLSVSAYLRQCVLDVDAMRVFVEKISAELHATAAAPIQSTESTLLPIRTPAPRAFPGLFAKCFKAFHRLLSR